MPAATSSNCASIGRTISLVEFTPEHGTVTFPRDARGADHPGDALVTFDAGSASLAVTIAATSPAQLEGLEGAVARHLDRFAFREAPLTFDWRAGKP